jgi:hypothetical protein
MLTMTAEQHLAMIDVIRSAIGRPDGPNQADGERMIRNHEIMARVRRRQPGSAGNGRGS